MATLQHRLSPSEAANRLGISPSRVVQLTREGKLSPELTSLGRLYDAAEIERLAVERATAPLVRKRPPQ